jgi:hypothetical protein
VLAILLSVLLCITLFPSAAFGATYSTPNGNEIKEDLTEVLQDTWTAQTQIASGFYYEGGVQMSSYQIKHEKLTLESDGTYNYRYYVYTDWYTGPPSSSRKPTFEESGTYQVAGKKITFKYTDHSPGAFSIDGTHIITLTSGKEYSGDATRDQFSLPVFQLSTLMRPYSGKIKSGETSDAFFAIYSLKVGDLYVGFGSPESTEVEVLSGTEYNIGTNYYYVDMYIGADTSSTFATADDVQSLTSYVLQKGKDPVKCQQIKIVVNGTFKSYRLSVPKTAVDSKTANFRYIEVFLNGKAFLLDTNKGFLSEVPSGLSGSENAATSGTSKKISNSKAFTIDIPDAAFAGKSTSGKVKITNNGKVLVKGKDYTVTYKNNKQIGKATATIKGIGKYSGTKTVTFKIVPKKTSISKVTAGAKNFKVRWKAVPASQKITKYQVRYKVKGAKKWATKTVSAKSTKLTVRKLVKGKTYQIQVRSYKTVKGVKYCSAWSTAKTSSKIK